MDNINFKNTKQRSIILKQLESLKTHPSAEELFFHIKKEYPSISLSTVYRNLENFYETGLINKINSKPARYDARKQLHHHAKCIKCGKIFDFDIDINFDDKYLSKFKFKIHNYILEINCTCNQCLNNN